MRASWLAALMCSASAGKDDSTTKLLDALTLSTAAIDAAVAQNPKLLTPAAGGSAVKGSLADAGTLDFEGWRLSGTHDGASGSEIAYSERLTLTFHGWTRAGVALDGAVLLARHSADFAPPMQAISDASETTSFRGRVAARGDAAGTFDIDVNAYAAGSTEWTCGVVNDKPAGKARCY